MLSELFQKLDQALETVAVRKAELDTAAQAFSGAQNAYNDAVTTARGLKAELLAKTADTLGDDRVRQ